MWWSLRQSWETRSDDENPSTMLQKWDGAVFCLDVDSLTICSGTTAQAETRAGFMRFGVLSHWPKHRCTQPLGSARRSWNPVM